MKIRFLILFAAFSFFLLSCDDGLKFNNPNDPNADISDSQNDEDKDSTDSIADEDPNEQADTENDENSDQNDTTPDEADSTDDNADSADDEDTIDPDVTDTGETVGETRVADCTGLPENASWNTVSAIVQTWNGEKWVPSSVASFNLEGSEDECRFKCDTNYKWNGSQCKSDSENNNDSSQTRTANCTDLPEHAIWNSVDSITQTYNGSNWEPSTNGVYNKEASTTECRYKCDTGYMWKDNACETALTRNESCDSLPANATWNTVDSITQTYDGSDWYPPTTPVYNQDGCTSECCFKCGMLYNWNGSMCVSLPKCAPSSGTPCLDFPYLLAWSARASIIMTWEQAVDYCNTYSEGGISGWHLPTVSELRTLIQNCQETAPGGSCGLTDECLSSDCWIVENCMCGSSDDGYSRLGDTGITWTSSVIQNNSDYAVAIGFASGMPAPWKKSEGASVRCVIKNY